MTSSKKAWVASALVLCSWLSPVVVSAQVPTDAERNRANYLPLEFLFALQGALIGGGAGYFGTYFALAILQPCPPNRPPQACEFDRSVPAVVIGTNLGIPVGAALFGVHLAGALLGIQGNLWLALAGGLVGSLAGLGAVTSLGADWAVQPSDLTLLINPMTMAALGATIGYNLGASVSSSAASVHSLRWTLALLQFRF